MTAINRNLIGARGAHRGLRNVVVEYGSRKAELTDRPNEKREAVLGWAQPALRVGPASRLRTVQGRARAGRRSRTRRTCSQIPNGSGEGGTHFLR